MAGDISTQALKTAAVLGEAAFLANGATAGWTAQRTERSRELFEVLPDTTPVSAQQPLSIGLQRVDEAGTGSGLTWVEVTGEVGGVG